MGDATYLRTCTRLLRLGCCRGSPGNMAGCLESKSARNFPGLSVGRPGVQDDWTSTLRDARAVAEVQPGGGAAGERYLEVDGAGDAKAVGLGGDSAAQKRLPLVPTVRTRLNT